MRFAPSGRFRHRLTPMSQEGPTTSEEVAVIDHSIEDHNSPTNRFYRTALELLTNAGLRFLVGGAYALEGHTGIIRRTKDFDIFVMPSDVHRVLEVLAGAGYATELTFPHWIGKAYQGEDFIDVIFSSGNAIGRVDEEWFQHALPGVVLGLPLLLCPVEETIWQKAFILERDRCDVADVAHLLRGCAARMDWPRLLRRFAGHWEVLYAQLTLFGFIYPSQRRLIPRSVMEELTARMTQNIRTPGPVEQICHGTLLSATQYLRDIGCEGYVDARLQPLGNMSEQDVAIWTANFAGKLNGQ